MDCSHEFGIKKKNIKIKNVYVKGGLVELGPFTLVVNYSKCKSCGREITRTNIIEEENYREEYFVSDRENLVRTGYSYTRKKK